MRKPSDSWLPPPTGQLELPLRLPPRPGIRRCCPKCGILHTERRDLMECLADHSQP